MLNGLLQYPDKSDRGLGRCLELSQPTISRLRTNLEDLGIIESYQIIPNLAGIGYEILSVGLTDVYDDKALYQDKHVILAYPTCGPKSPCLVMSVHRNYTEYTRFSREFNITSVAVISTQHRPVKALSFNNVEASSLPDVKA